MLRSLVGSEMCIRDRDNNCFTVVVVQLQNSDGTRYVVGNGLEDEESTFDCLCGDTIQLNFSHAPRPLGRIKVYSTRSHQHAAAAASSSPQWTHLQRHEAQHHEEGTLYGFIDVFKIKQQQQQLRYGECWFVDGSRVSVMLCAVLLQRRVSQSSVSCSPFWCSIRGVAQHPAHAAVPLPCLWSPTDTHGCHHSMSNVCSGTAK